MGNPSRYGGSEKKVFKEVQVIPAEEFLLQADRWAPFGVAARQNAQLTNVSNISRDAAVARQTVQVYFNVLIDTLIGYWLPAWKLKRATKQVAHPKFYFFDTGVVRALSGRLPYEPSFDAKGPLLETLLINELRAYVSYTGRTWPLHFWRTPEGVEIDVLFETDRGYIAVEIKSSLRWESTFGRGLARLAEEMKGKIYRRYGVFWVLEPRKLRTAWKSCPQKYFWTGFGATIFGRNS